MMTTLTCIECGKPAGQTKLAMFKGEIVFVWCSQCAYKNYIDMLAGKAKRSNSNEKTVSSDPDCDTGP
jgi:ssDNA-binding Zn-finger/Zn-ribbon topoisomerase 1